MIESGTRRSLALEPQLLRAALRGGTAAYGVDIFLLGFAGWLRSHGLVAEYDFAAWAAV